MDMDEKSAGKNSHVAWTGIGDFITNYIVEQTCIGCAVLVRRCLRA